MLTVRILHASGFSITRQIADSETLLSAVTAANNNPSVIGIEIIDYKP